MKVLQINIFGNLSTGRIAVDIYHLLKDTGNESVVAFARNEIEANVDHYRIGGMLNVYIDGVLTRLTDKAGHFSKNATKKLLLFIDEYDPDVVHLHNLHGYYINVPILFSYLKKRGIPVVWTLHDCWAMTGHCCYFVSIGCEKWKTQCDKCILLKEYPASYLIDRSRINYIEKKKMFSEMPNLHIVTVSKWLESIVRSSYLQMMDIRTIYNGVDTTVFKPVNSAIKQKLGIKKMVLGVASTWTENKGMNDFIELSKILPKDYTVVLVGLDKDQIETLPNIMIGLPRTSTIEELVEFYSAADVYVNASFAETFGMPTLEAMACGTPAIVYNSTALPEVCSTRCGVVIEPHDIISLKKNIEELSNKPKDSNLYRSHALSFDKGIQYRQYIELYEQLCNRKTIEGNR